MDAAPENAPLFRAVLTPQRSLDRRGLIWASALLGGLAAIAAVMFVVLGAWPVVGFVGVEIGVALLLLWLHQRAGRAHEVVLLDEASLTVTRIDHLGRRREWRLPPAWLRVAAIPADGARAGHVTLATHGRSLAIGAFLTDQEQAELVAALEAALARWRQPVMC